MDVILYSTTSEQKALDKVLTSSHIYEGALKEQTAILTPSLYISADNLAGYNYMHIPDFSRYYFITGVESVRNGLWLVHGRVDVLSTYATGIRNLTAIITRQENVNLCDMYLNDPLFLTQNKQWVNSYKFPNGFGNQWELFISYIGGAE